MLFTSTSAPTVSFINLTSSAVAPPPAKPVEVLTKSAPAALLIHWLLRFRHGPTIPSQ